MSSSSMLRSASSIFSLENEWLACLQKELEERTPEDIEIIFSKLKTLRVYENYPEDLLHEIAQYSTYEEVPPHSTLFRPGDEGLFWYTVLSGSLEMLQGNDDSSKVNSICSLGEGSSFGENVIFGSKRETMIVTTDHCQLVCVEADHIRRIYEMHKATMKDFVNLPDRLTSSGEDSVDALDGESDVDVFSDDPLILSTPVDYTPESELTLAGLTLYQVISEHFPDLFSDNQVNLYTYKKCCSGKKLIEWVLSQSSAARSRQQVITMWQAMLTEGIIQHVLNKNHFEDDNQVYYRFVERAIPEYARILVRPNSPGSRPNDTRNPSQSYDSLLDSPIMSRSSTFQSVSSGTEASPSSSPRSSITSLLEECFDVISQLGPESLIFATLMKPPADRVEEDIQLIYEELLHVKAFGHLSNAIKEELAAVVHFEHHPTAGRFLYREGDSGTSWYIILRGSVNVMIGRKGVVCTLQEGDEFGKLALLNNAPRTSSIQLREPNCCFLKVDREDFKRILMSVEKNTVKFKEHGKEVLVLEKSAGGRYLVVKGTSQKMLGYLLTLQLDPGSLDESFAQDFFLTYPAFMSINDVCDGLKDCYNNYSPPQPSPVTHSPPQRTEEAPTMATNEQMTVKRKRVVRAMGIWLAIAKSDLIKDPTFQKLLHYMQDSLANDGLVEELKEVNMRLMDSIRRGPTLTHDGGKVSTHLSLFPLKKNNSDIRIELGICTVPPCQPIDAVNVRVHTVDKRCCRLHVKLDTKAEEILQQACTKLSLEFENYELCEAKSSGEKVIFNPKDLSISTEMTINGRLYAMPKDGEKTITPLPDQNQRPVTPFPESDGSREIACHLTMYDWNLFSNIQQMEFIYQVFGRHRFSRITSNLDLLTRRFNEIQYWVVTEVCNESNLHKRVKVLVKMIKIASHCKSFNNLNSFFAIVVALMNGAIGRLKQTWERVPIKLRRRYEQFASLMDPSRNHRVLRAYQSKLQPPVIPFMPLVVKDAYFLHEGNQTFVDELINFEKMRMVASKVRHLNVYRKGLLPNEIKTVTNKTPGLQKYIRELKVIDNQQMLMQMSHTIEPSKRLRNIST